MQLIRSDAGALGVDQAELVELYRLPAPEGRAGCNELCDVAGRFGTRS